MDLSQCERRVSECRHLRRYRCALSFLGSAGAGLKASFGSSGAIYLSAAGVHIRRVAEVAALREELLTAAQTRRYARGTALVAATLTATKALVLTSRSAHASFEATSRVPLTPLPASPDRAA